MYRSSISSEGRAVLPRRYVKGACVVPMCSRACPNPRGGSRWRFNPVTHFDGRRNPSMIETRELRKRDPDAESRPVPEVEPQFSSVPAHTASPIEALFPEADLLNAGNTRPPQHLLHFNGDEIERTYLTYFLAGDMYSYRHGTKVRVEGGTTHPAQLELMCD